MISVLKAHKFTVSMPTLTSDIPLRILFCSGLGGAGLCVVLSFIYAGFSSTDGRILFEVPGLEVCGCSSELMLLFTLVPGVGD